jgi:hypothetical protein
VGLIWGPGGDLQRGMAKRGGTLVEATAACQRGPSCRIKTIGCIHGSSIE